MPDGLTVRPLFHATATENMVLPIVDVTSAAFAISPSAEGLAVMEEQYVRESTRSQEVPPELRAALASSRLGSGLMAARGTFLTGLNTYLLKLGPDNLPADFHPIDRRIAASFPAVTARLRLQDMAALLTDGLAQALVKDPQRPLHFINIAGGPYACVASTRHWSIARSRSPYWTSTVRDLILAVERSRRCNRKAHRSMACASSSITGLTTGRNQTSCAAF
jgi:hypothetical protein